MVDRADDLKNDILYMRLLVRLECLLFYVFCHDV